MAEEEIEQGKQNKYNEIVFGESFSKNGEDLSEKKEKMIQAALDQAHEIRKFEIELYWKRSLFFWGFILTFLTAFALISDFKNDNLTNNSTSIVMVLLSGIGFFTTFSWHFIEVGSKTWQANWEKHIDFLENQITGKLYKTTIGKPSEFFSVSKIHSTFISSMVFFWTCLFLLNICYALNINVYDLIAERIGVIKLNFSNQSHTYVGVILAMAIFGIIFIIFSCFVESWRTNFGIEPPDEPIEGDRLTLRFRELPDVHFVMKGHKKGQ